MKIGKTLQNKRFDLNLERLITGRTFICSMSRFGKSYTVRKICEELFGKTGIIILDPEGEYSSLRELYPYLIIGRDIPLNPQDAELLAEETLNSDLSLICDFSMVNMIDQQDFTIAFIDKLMELETKLKKSYLIIVEEADEFIPEKGTFKAGTLHSMINLCKKGRKRGLGVILISQRPAFISKYALSQCNNKAIGHTEWSVDLKLFKDYLRLSDEAINTIRTLDPGQFYFQGDFCLSDFVQIDQVKTTHLGETPKVIPPAPKELRRVLADLQTKIKEIEKKEEIKIETPKIPIPRISPEEIESKVDQKVREQTEDYRLKLEEFEVDNKKLKKFISLLIYQANQILGQDTSQDESAPVMISQKYQLWLEKLGKAPKTILEEMIKHKRLTRAQLGIATGYSYKGGGFNNALSKLNTIGLIRRDGDVIILVE